MSGSGSLSAPGMQLAGQTNGYASRGAFGSTNITFSGSTSGSTINFTFNYYVIGDICCLQWAEATRSATSATEAFTAAADSLPSDLRPACLMYFPVIVIEGGNPFYGSLEIETNGSMRFFKIACYDYQTRFYYWALANSGTTGISGGSVFYRLNVPSSGYISCGQYKTPTTTSNIAHFTSGTFSTNMTGPWAGNASFTFAYTQVGQIVLGHWLNQYTAAPPGTNFTGVTGNNTSTFMTNSANSSDMPSGIRPISNVGIFQCIGVVESGNWNYGSIESAPGSTPALSIYSMNATWSSRDNFFSGTGAYNIRSSGLCWISSAPTTITPNSTLYINDITLPNGGLSARKFSNYGSGSFSQTFNSSMWGSGSVASTVYWAKFDRLVCMSFANVTATANGTNGYISTSSAITSALRPISDVNFFCRLIFTHGGTSRVCNGTLSITTGGLMTIHINYQVAYGGVNYLQTKNNGIWSNDNGTTLGMSGGNALYISAS